MSRRLSRYRKEFQEIIEKIGNGLEKHLDTPIEFLSGGQRQALSLLMATLKRPELLLLDEHTAALDPKTSVALMELTDDFVQRDQLTALMITSSHGGCSQIWQSSHCHERRTDHPRPQTGRKSQNDHSGLLWFV